MKIGNFALLYGIQSWIPDGNIFLPRHTHMEPGECQHLFQLFGNSQIDILLQHLGYALRTAVFPAVPWVDHHGRPLPCSKIGGHFPHFLIR